MLHWFWRAMASYAAFEGRSSRAEFWSFTIVAILLQGSLVAIGVTSRNPSLPVLFWLVTLLPSIAVTVRRLHDIGQSGLWYLLWLLPLVGGLILLVLLLLPGQPERNRFGPPPRPRRRLTEPA